MDFSKLVEVFDQSGVTFVSVTQSFNTTTSMGRLTLNILLSFAQFEREVIAERVRDKIRASRQKGMWMGGNVPFGYRVENRKLLVQEPHASTVFMMFERFLRIGSATVLARDLRDEGVRAPSGKPFDKGALYHLLNNRTYLGLAVHKGTAYPGQHAAIIDQDLWDTLGLTDDHDRLAELAGHILTHGLEVVTSRDVQRGVHNMRKLDGREVLRLFEQLEAFGWVERTPGKRPSDPPWWRVNPVVHQRFADRAQAEAARRQKARAALAALGGGR
jgi:hypothetical protein